MFIYILLCSYKAVYRNMSMWQNKTKRWNEWSQVWDEKTAHMQWSPSHRCYPAGLLSSHHEIYNPACVYTCHFVSSWNVDPSSHERSVPLHVCSECYPFPLCPGFWFCPLSLSPLYLGSVSSSCRHVQLSLILPCSPKIHSWSSYFSPVTAPFCLPFQHFFFKRIICTNFIFVSSPPTYSQPAPIWFSFPNWDPSCADQSFLLETFSALLCVLTSDSRFFCLSGHFPPQPLLVAVCPGILQLDSVPSLSLCVHCHCPFSWSQILSICFPSSCQQLRPFFWTPYSYIQLLTWYVLLEFSQAP